MKAFKQSNDNELLLKKKKKKGSVLINLYIKKNVFHQFSNKINFLAYIFSFSFSFSFLSAYELQQGNNNSKKDQRKRTTIIAEREK